MFGRQDRMGFYVAAVFEKAFTDFAIFRLGVFLCPFVEGICQVRSQSIYSPGCFLFFGDSQMRIDIVVELFRISAK